MPRSGHDRRTLAAWTFQVPGFLLFGLLSVGSKPRKMWRHALLALVIGLVLFAVACGSGSTTTTTKPQAGTTPGTYTMLVTASSGYLNHTIPLTITVR
jgi:peptidoglycan/LPS O-acetylase OafA/YrhL